MLIGQEQAAGTLAAGHKTCMLQTLQRHCMPSTTIRCVQGVLVELPLAGFFLKKMRNPHSDINDLLTLDPELYRNLMFLREYEGNFADLALTFTTADNDLDANREVSLASHL